MALTFRYISIAPSEIIPDIRKDLGVKRSILEMSRKIYALTFYWTKWEKNVLEYDKNSKAKD